jgi:BirA family transcriptional regulator, biotin operon repressor / biotin---[acetyl-CoA-carboxylase] ligase
MSGEVMRHIEVGLSAESVAGAWARQEAAPHGALVSLAGEVAGRSRGGVPVPPGPAIAVIVRPSLAADSHDRLWLAALVAAHRSIPPLGETRLGWPDSIETDPTTAASGPVPGSPATVLAASGPVATVPVASVTVTAQLGPGHVEMAIITVRSIQPWRMPDPDEFRRALLRTVSQAESDFLDLVADYAAVSTTHGQRIRVQLLPRGETRGTATGFEPDGRLRLETPTGMVELLPVAVVRSISLV